MIRLSRRDWIAAGLFLVTVALFWQVRNHDFVPYDDDYYVYENADLQRGFSAETVQWAFTTGRTSNWHPLTWLSLLLDYERYELHPSGYHLMNLVLHVANVVLLFLLLHRLTGSHWRSAMVAALFALHPLHVESVAWVSSRKDVLSTLFWLLTTFAYLRFVEERLVRRYLLMAVLFSFGLMSKPMLVTLPFTLLLLDFWPLGRFSRKSADQQSPPTHRAADGFRTFASLLWEKVPLIVLAAVSSVITYLVQQRGGAVSAFEHIRIGDRLANAVVSYAVYVRKMFWPSDLAVFYPHEAERLSSTEIGLAGVFLAVATYLALRSMHRYSYGLTGWLWYLGTLVPVIGIVQVGAQAMADRYTYVPLIGLFIIIAWGAADVARRWPRLKPIVVALCLGAVVACGWMTWNQLGYWQNGETLFRRALEITENNWIAHNNLGTLLEAQGRYAEAEEQFARAVSIYPQVPQLQNNLGIALRHQGKFEAAVGRFHEALRLDPNREDAIVNLGTTLKEMGGEDEAERLYEDALRRNENFHNARYNLALLLMRKGNREAAIRHLEELLERKPDDAEARKVLEQLRTPEP